MTFPLKELTRLLSQDATVVGSVVSIDGVLVRVATERGMVLARTLDVLSVGDRVLLQNGVAIKAPVAKTAFPV